MSAETGLPSGPLRETRNGAANQTFVRLFPEGQPLPCCQLTDDHLKERDDREAHATSRIAPPLGRPGERAAYFVVRLFHSGKYTAYT